MRIISQTQLLIKMNRFLLLIVCLSVSLNIILVYVFLMQSNSLKMQIAEKKSDILKLKNENESESTFSKFDVNGDGTDELIYEPLAWSFGHDMYIYKEDVGLKLFCEHCTFSHHGGAFDLKRNKITVVADNSAGTIVDTVVYEYKNGDFVKVKE